MVETLQQRLILSRSPKQNSICPKCHLIRIWPPDGGIPCPLPVIFYEAWGILRNFSSFRPTRTRSAFKRVSFSNPCMTWFSTAAASSLRCIFGIGRPKRLTIRKRLATSALDQVVELAIKLGRAMQTSTPSFSVGNLRTMSSVLR